MFRFVIKRNIGVLMDFEVRNVILIGDFLFILLFFIKVWVIIYGDFNSNLSKILCDFCFFVWFISFCK